MKVYAPKSLINGWVIKQEGLFVAVPDKNFKGETILVSYGGEKMEIKDWNKAVTFRRFHDKFGGSDYTLAYFKWLPRGGENQ